MSAPALVDPKNRDVCNMSAPATCQPLQDVSPPTCRAVQPVSPSNMSALQHVSHASMSAEDLKAKVRTGGTSGEFSRAKQRLWQVPLFISLGQGSAIELSVGARCGCFGVSAWRSVYLMGFMDRGSY
jgi:hypothetical protein